MVGYVHEQVEVGTVVAMLAILRAGGAVVPLGVGHPLARIEGIVQDIAAPLVLVDRGHEQRLDGADWPKCAAACCRLFLRSGIPATPAATPEASAYPCTIRAARERGVGHLHLWQHRQA